MAKKPILAVPKNTLEANASLYRIGTIDRDIADIETSLAAAIATLQNEAVAKLKSLVDERKDRLVGLEQFAVDNRADILADGRKSVELAAGVIGWRMTPLKVVLARGGEKKALETLKRLRLQKYIRTKESLDKQSLLRERPEITGIRYVQREAFFAEAKTDIPPEAAANVIALARPA